MGNSHRRVCLVPRVPERSAQQETTQRFEKTETAADRIGPGYQRGSDVWREEVTRGISSRLMFICKIISLPLCNSD